MKGEPKGLLFSSFILHPSSFILGWLVARGVSFGKRQSSEFARIFLAFLAALALELRSWIV
jgi:hypothetical protein